MKKTKEQIEMLFGITVAFGTAIWLGGCILISALFPDSYGQVFAWGAWGAFCSGCVMVAHYRLTQS